MRIAIIGAGISGLGAALALKDQHDVTLYEAESRLGGHANTVTIDYDGAAIDVDTGFIVFNNANYPNLVAMLDYLGVETYDSDMSFAVSDPSRFEWSSNGVRGMFAWKRNLARPAFLGMLSDIVRFSTAARSDLKQDGKLTDETLEEYVSNLGLSRGFLRDYLLPMGAAIWSTPEPEMLKYPAQSFLRFFDNHRLLHAKRPLWRTIKGGSRVYVTAAAKLLGDRIKPGAAVSGVRRMRGQVQVRLQSGDEALFDHVLFACHSDQALALLLDADSAEQGLLSAVRYAPNTAYLHRDRALMPRREAAWASWNYLREPGDNGAQGVCVSYWMNLLQAIPREKPLFVTLNPKAPPRPELTFQQFSYAHPQFDVAALRAQRDIGAIQNRNGVTFAGAWLGYGFHEDGLSSGLGAAARLGGVAPWAANTSAGQAILKAAA
jgi:uncharacterized protein